MLGAALQIKWRTGCRVDKHASTIRTSLLPSVVVEYFTLLIVRDSLIRHRPPGTVFDVRFDDVKVQWQVQ